MGLGFVTIMWIFVCNCASKFAFLSSFLVLYVKFGVDVNLGVGFWMWMSTLQ